MVLLCGYVCVCVCVFSVFSFEIDDMLLGCKLKSPKSLGSEAEFTTGR
jgi:hypothetical protein